MEGLLFGVGAALCFGFAGIAATLASRQSGILRPLIVMHAGGVLLLSPFLVIAPVSGTWGLRSCSASAQPA